MHHFLTEPGRFLSHTQRYTQTITAYSSSSVVMTMNLETLSVATFVFLFLLLLTRNLASDLDSLPFSQDDPMDGWTNPFPLISDDRFDGHQRLNRLQDPLPESIQNWPHHQLPTIYLDYDGKHPFENRELQQSSSSSNYQPIRIAFITSQLESQLNKNSYTDAKIRYILDSILPEVQNLWSSRLRVIPNTQNITFDSSVCFGVFNGLLPNEVLQYGVDADMVIIASAINVAAFSDGYKDVFCSTNSGKLAFAVLCARDQLDRPAIGFINFCLNATTTVARRRLEREEAKQEGDTILHASDENRHHRQTSNVVSNGDQLLVTIHEITHVLGMNSASFPYFRNATTGEPLTPRPFSNQTVQCIYNHTQTNIFPASNTVQLGVTDKGIIYYEVVTPRVRQVTRNHFNCQSLTGARLEDQDTNPTDCTGSHWSSRLFFGELMEAKILLGSKEVLSPLTLALLEDTGWYHVDYVNISLLPFGLNAGCDFVNRDCILSDAVPDYGKGYFCNYTTPVQSNSIIPANSSLFCDPDHYEWTSCSLINLQQTPTSLVSLEAPNGVPVRYFSNTNLASLFPQGEFCPMAVIPVGVSCTDPTTQAKITYKGETYGSSSRCVDVYAFDSQTGSNSNLPGCFDIQCDPSTFQVIVNGYLCTYDFEEITIESVYSTPVTMTCPRLSTLCPDLFCPSDCSGQGTCDYSTNPPRCKCFDSSDTSSSCSASVATGSGPNPSVASTPSVRSTVSPTFTIAPGSPHTGSKHTTVSKTFIPTVPSHSISPAPTRKPSIFSFIVSSAPQKSARSMRLWVTAATATMWAFLPV